MRFWLLIVCVCVMLAGPLRAEQVSYKARIVGQSVKFDYVWRDASRAEQRLGFFLPVDDLRRGQSEFQPFSDKAVSDAAFKAVQKEAATASDPQGVSWNVERTAGGFDVKAEGPVSMINEDAMAKQVEVFNQVREKATDAYLADRFYVRINPTNVMPDHKRIVQRYAPALAPVQAAVRAATKGQQPHEVVDYLLGFLQSIPYDTLQNRRSSNGAGFQTPYGLITGNRGDCDTKSVALLALLRGIFPQTRLVMVYVPEHAFVGLALPRGSKDFALNIKGQAFVLADPTGPRLLKLGEVAEDALAELEAGKYSYQEVLY